MNGFFLPYVVDH